MDYEQKHPILQKLEEYFKNTPKEQIDKDWSNILKDTDSEAYYEKKYKEALERAMKLQETCNNTAVVGWCEYIFPELKESEDERIRKAIIAYIDHGQHNGISNKDMVAWLEKQGEKSTIIDVEKMVMEYSQTKDGDFGLPVNCMIRAYRKGINDALKLSLNVEKQGKKLDADEVIEWLNHHELSYDDVVTTVVLDDSRTSISHWVKWLSDEFIKQFKKDFGL